MSKAICIYIDFTNGQENEYYVQFDDPVINKNFRFTETDKHKVVAEIDKVMKLNKLTNYMLFDTTGHFTKGA